MSLSMAPLTTRMLAGVLCAVVLLGACSSPTSSAIVSRSDEDSASAPTGTAEVATAPSPDEDSTAAPEAELPAFDNQPLTTGDGPAEGDHWHSPFGVMICGEFIDEPIDRAGLQTGIHTHADGLVHLHPSTSEVLGEKAVLDVFLAEVDIDVADGVMRLPTGPSFRDGDDCAGVPSIVQLVIWDRHTNPVPTEVRTTDIGATRFLRDTQTFVLAFMPEGATIPRPPSINTLSNWSAVT